jgi:hypothetical protein
VKRPPRERARLLRLIRVIAVAGVLILALGLAAVVGGVFDPSRGERARDWVDQEYGARLGACEELTPERLECELERPTPRLLDRLGRPPRERVCIFVFENASVVLNGWAPCRSP